MQAPEPVPTAPVLKLSELLGALSHALDLTEGQPPGHCVRSCWIGMAVGAEIGLSDAQLWELYYTVLLKDLGCSSNAARICELYLADDLVFKDRFKLVDGSLAQVLNFLVRHTGANAKLSERLRALKNIMQNGPSVVRELIETRCHRGADIARQLRFPEPVAQGIQHLDEHWDGGGQPEGRAGAEIPVYAQIALMAQVAEVFHASAGPAAATLEIARRSGRWFDPFLAAAFRNVARRPAFWEALEAEDLPARVYAMEPASAAVVLDEDYLDDIAKAFGQVVDAKSPYTAGHSDRVAVYADLIAEQLGVGEQRRRWLRRAALLHDLGKLGVSNAILDKPDKLDDGEFAAVQAHAAYTQQILSRISAFEEMAEVAAAHHERLDGRGYPLGLAGDQISLETRIISVADFFDALTAERPYRGAMSAQQAYDIMDRSVGVAIDPAVFAALKTAVAALESARKARQVA